MVIWFGSGAAPFPWGSGFAAARRGRRKAAILECMMMMF
jgi:hypothetical protein